MRVARFVSSLIFSVILSFGVAFAGYSVSAVSVCAEEIQTGANAFDDTNVNDDLAGLDLSAITPSASLDPSLFYFTEYCFAAETEENVNYALYLYVYNPRRFEFRQGDGENVVNIAVEYDESGQPTRYANVGLKYCGSSKGALEGLIIKFRVIDKDNQILANAVEQNRTKNERRYDITGVQLWREGYAMANDYNVGVIYRFSGYAEGYGKYVEESTLEYHREQTETVELDVKHAFYRPDGTNGQENTQDTLSSVYFAVPNDDIEEFGELYKVHFSYLKAITDWIFVTGNSAVYNELRQYVGQDIEGLDLRYGFGTGRTSSAVVTPGSGLGLIKTSINYDYSYNKQKTINGIFYHTTNNKINELKYVLPVDGGMDQENSADDYVLSWEDLQEYMLDYSKERDDLIYNRYARELFSWVAAEETDETLSAKDEFHLTGITFDNWWNKLWGIETETPYDMPAIQEVKSCQSAAQVKADYYIDESCYNDFSAYYLKYSTNSTIYVFHFAQDDYYSSEATELDNESSFGYEMDSNAYLARETVYLNFDVIDISMKKGDDITVLGVVASPIDVIPSPTPPVETTPDGGLGDWFAQLIRAIVAIIVTLFVVAIIVIFWGPISTILGLLGNLIALPFKAISDAIKNRKKKE